MNPIDANICRIHLFNPFYALELRYEGCKRNKT